MSHASTICPGRLRALHEVTWELAHGDLSRITRTDLLSDARLLEFWTATRGLAKTWLRQLDEFRDCAARGEWRTAVAVLERVGSELFLSELLVRLLSTVIACWEAERRKSSHDPGGPGVAQPVLERALAHLQHPRTVLLADLLHCGEPITAIDRLRRRCERWCDLFIGPWIVRYGVSAFAHDPRRAWDYGEDALVDLEYGYQRELLRRSYAEAFRSRLLEAPWQTDLITVLYRCALDLLDKQPPEAETRSTTSNREALSTNADVPSRYVAGLLERCLRQVLPQDEPHSGG